MKDLTVAELTEIFSCSRQNINYHLTKLEAEFPDQILSYKSSRKRYITQSGFDLLKQHIELPDANKSKKTKTNKENSQIHNKEQNDKEQIKAKQNFKEYHDHSDQVFQQEYKNQLLEERIEELKEELKFKNKLIEEMMEEQKETRKEITILAQNAQKLVQNQQELTLLDRGQLPEPASPQKDLKTSSNKHPFWVNTALYIKAIRDTFKDE